MGPFTEIREPYEKDENVAKEVDVLIRGDHARRERTRCDGCGMRKGTFGSTSAFNDHRLICKGGA